jgi:hypothetical protein
MLFDQLILENCSAGYARLFAEKLCFSVMLSKIIEAVPPVRRHSRGILLREFAGKAQLFRK